MCPYPGLSADVRAGDPILVDDGRVVLEVVVIRGEQDLRWALDLRADMVALSSAACWEHPAGPTRVHRIGDAIAWG